MKKSIVVIVFSILSIPAFTQGIIEGRSSPKAVNITKDLSKSSENANVITGQSATGLVNIVKDKGITVKPPRLQADAPYFVDTDGNGFLNANENSKIYFTVSNLGESPAVNLTASISEKNKVPGLSFLPKTIGTLPPGETKTFDIQVSGSSSTINQTASFIISLSDANGNSVTLPPVAVQVKAYEAPLVKIADVGWDPITKGMPFNITVSIQNTGPGSAENVIITLPLPDDIIFVEGSKSVEIGDLASGETQTVNYTLITKPSYTLSQVFLPFKLSERYGKYVDNSKSTRTILIEQALASNKNVPAQGAQGNVAVQQPKAPASEPAQSFTSDVDINIPVNTVKNPKRIALIIGNENYSQYFDAESDVDFAKNDATVFKKYAISILGVEETKIIELYNATSGMMRKEIERVATLLQKAGSSSELIFYYAGHGYPDETTHIPYLIPVDVNVTDLTSAIKLSDVYAKFGSSGASKMIVFLDACFSGGGRNQVVYAVRGARIPPNNEGTTPSGNMIVFSASQGSQSAQAYNKQKHGFFTYYLLKKLKESPRDLTYEQLFNSIKESVSFDAVLINGKEQDPDIIISPDLGDKWKTWKVK